MSRTPNYCDIMSLDSQTLNCREQEDNDEEGLEGPSIEGVEDRKLSKKTIISVWVTAREERTKWMASAWAVKTELVWGTRPVKEALEEISTAAIEVLWSSLEVLVAKTKQSRNDEDQSFRQTWLEHLRKNCLGKWDRKWLPWGEDFSKEEASDNGESLKESL